MTLPNEDLNVQVIILAAGEAKRYDGICKQLMDIGGETVVHRIIRQCNLRGRNPVVVTTNKEIQDAVYLRCPSAAPYQMITVCDTLRSTFRLWLSRNIILLGDVIYSKSTMDAHFGYRSPIRVFGDMWEIFGIGFDGSVSHKVKAALEVASKHRLGKLRYFYKYYCGFDMDQPEVEREPLERNIFYKIDDWTVDIDSPRDHNKFMREVVKPGRLDDRE